MTNHEELTKACQEATDAAMGLLKKSQQTFDFGGSTNPHLTSKDKADQAHDEAEESSYQAWAGNSKGTKEAHKKAEQLHKIAAEAHTAIGDKHTAKWHKDQAEIHHKAYSRISTSGKVSQIAAKGTQTPDKREQHILSVSDQLSELKTPREGTSFSQRILGHGRKNNLPHEEIARMSSALHASEAATTREGHGRAHLEHKAAALKASDPVYKRYHEESADYHKQQTDERKALRQAKYKEARDRANEMSTRAHDVESHIAARRAHNTAYDEAESGGADEAYHLNAIKHHTKMAKELSA